MPALPFDVFIDNNLTSMEKAPYMGAIFHWLQGLSNREPPPAIQQFETRSLSMDLCGLVNFDCMCDCCDFHLHSNELRNAYQYFS